MWTYHNIFTLRVNKLVSKGEVGHRDRGRVGLLLPPPQVPPGGTTEGRNSYNSGGTYWGVIVLQRGMVHARNGGKVGFWAGQDTAGISGHGKLCLPKWRACVQTLDNNTSPTVLMTS